MIFLFRIQDRVDAPIRSSTTANKNSSDGSDILAIVTSVVVGVLLIIAIALAIFCFVRRRQKRKRKKILMTFSSPGKPYVLPALYNVPLSRQNSITSGKTYHIYEDLS